MLIDVHTHLDFPEFDEDLEEVIERAKSLDFSILITNGTGPASNRKVLEISKKYDIVKPALGIYPSTAIELSDKAIEEELKFIKKNKPIAIGEVGIDYYHTDIKEKQKETFRKFIKFNTYYFRIYTFI